MLLRKNRVMQTSKYFTKLALKKFDNNYKTNIEKMLHNKMCEVLQVIFE